MSASPTFAARYGPYALVAGASEGLGAEFAHRLAARGLHLVLLARRADKLAEVAAAIRAKHAVDVRTAAVDLAAPDLVDRARAAAAGCEIGLVVYNAALAPIGPFLDRDLDELFRAVDVNCRGPVALAHAFGRDMVARGRGGILLMSSLAGTQGTPLVAVYGATKAFNLVLAEALWDELRARGVDVLACRAGATRTPNYEKSAPTEGGAPLMEPGPVVESALDSLGRTPSMVPGFTNRLAAIFLGRVLPRRAAVRFLGGTMRKMYGK